jgi:hypothetical protein
MEVNPDPDLNHRSRQPKRKWKRARGRPITVGGSPRDLTSHEEEDGPLAKDVPCPYQDFSSHPRISFHDSAKAADPRSSGQSADGTTTPQAPCPGPCPSPSPPASAPETVVSGQEPVLELADPGGRTRGKIGWNCDSACEVCSVDAEPGCQSSARRVFRLVTVKVRGNQESILMASSLACSRWTSA